MSNIICLLACKNLFRGQNAIGYTEHYIASFNMALGLFVPLAFMIINNFLRFKYEIVGDVYKTIIEMIRNEKVIRNFFFTVCVNEMIEILTCYLIRRVYETGRKVNSKEVVGFLIAPVIVRAVIIRVMKPTAIQFFISSNNAANKIENDKRNEKKTRNKRSIIFIVANKHNSYSKNNIKKLPIELIRTLNEYLE